MKLYNMDSPKHIGKLGAMWENYLRDCDQDVYVELVWRGKLQ